MNKEILSCDICDKSLTLKLDFFYIKLFEGLKNPCVKILTILVDYILPGKFT